MDAAGLSALHRLIAMGGRSLLQYVSEACPWTTEKNQGEFTQVLALAQEEEGAVAKLTRYLQKKHQRRVVLGSYPSHFTLMNYVDIDYLLPKLVADTQSQLAAIAKLPPIESDEELRHMVAAYAEMQQRHLAALQRLRTPRAA